MKDFVGLKIMQSMYGWVDEKDGWMEKDGTSGLTEEESSRMLREKGGRKSRLWEGKGWQGVTGNEKSRERKGEKMEKKASQKRSNPLLRKTPGKNILDSCATSLDHW